MLTLLTKADEVRGKWVWERHNEFSYRQDLCGCNGISGSAVQQAMRHATEMQESISELHTGQHQTVVSLPLSLT